MVTARAKPSPGTCWKPSSRASRSSGWSSTRSPSRRSCEAAENPRDLDIDLVDAQETRRILDRLYGYEVSPVLWKKVAPKLSAGRVQSVATRIIVQRERDRMAFRSASYWDIVAQLDASVSDPQAQPPTFTARLTNVDGLRVATGRDFDSLGVSCARPTKSSSWTRRSATELADGLARRAAVRRVGGGEALHPAPVRAVHDVDAAAGGRPQVAVLLRAHDEHRPAALRERLHHLYAYRLDDAVGVGDQRRAQPGASALRRGVRLAVAASVHPQGEERPGGARGDPARRRDVRHPGRGAPRARRRRIPALRADLAAHGGLADGRRARHHAEPADRGHGGWSGRNRDVVFSASGRTITFAGFLKAYVETVDELAGGEADDAERRLPHLTQGQRLDAIELTPDGHATNPPARYTEASLVKALEELGIGRPSTYSSIIKTIQDRGYVYKKGSALVPSWVAFAVTGLLEQHFGRLVDYDFTAAMEDELDAIASGTSNAPTGSTTSTSAATTECPIRWPAPAA